MFYHMHPIHKAIAQELITIHLVSKELLFGLAKTTVSSIDLLAAVDARDRFGSFEANSELVDDMNFKTANTNASRNQLGNIDNAARFRDCYLEMLGLGGAYDYNRELKLRRRTLMQFSLNPGISMARAVGFGINAGAEAHDAYARLVPYTPSCTIHRHEPFIMHHHARCQVGSVWLDVRSTTRRRDVLLGV